MTKKLPQNTIPKFLLQVIKPYKWWYLLMMQAPIVNSFYKVFSMVAVAKVVDVFTATEIPQYSNFLYPIISKQDDGICNPVLTFMSRLIELKMRNGR